VNERAQGKAETRAKLLAAALDHAAERSLAAISLRAITREAGVVPGAFYRHFASVEELGLALVDEAFGALREIVRAARTPSGSGLSGRETAEIVLRYVRERRGHFRFVARERFGGVPAVRAAIARELELFASELAVDLGRSPVLGRWAAEDVRLVADLVMTVMVRAVEESLDTPAGDLAAEERTIARTERQLLLIGLGARELSAAPAS
jgi:AcrR family transcriptional regulator